MIVEWLEVPLGSVRSTVTLVVAHFRTMFCVTAFGIVAAASAHTTDICHAQQCSFAASATHSDDRLHFHCNDGYPPLWCHFRYPVCDQQIVAQSNYYCPTDRLGLNGDVWPVVMLFCDQSHGLAHDRNALEVIPECQSIEIVLDLL